MISFFVKGEPKGQPRPRAFARKMPGGKFIARVFDAGTAEAWKSQIALSAAPHIPATKLTGSISLIIHFYFSRPKGHFNSKGVLKPSAPPHHTAKPDLDNLDKAVMDALTTIGMWEDDKQVCAKFSSRSYADEKHQGAYIEIQEIK